MGMQSCDHKFSISSAYKEMAPLHLGSQPRAFSVQWDYILSIGQVPQQLPVHMPSTMVTRQLDRRLILFRLTLMTRTTTYKWLKYLAPRKKGSRGLHISYFGLVRRHAFSPMQHFA